MAILFGDKSRFAAEIGEFRGEDHRFRRVDFWAAERRLTCDDNDAFAEQLCMSLCNMIDWLRSGPDLIPPFPELDPAETHRRLLALDDGSRESFWFPRWGPITDNVTGHVFRWGETLTITFEFWRETHPVPEERGVVFVAELPEQEFLSVLEKTFYLLLEGG